MESIIAKPEREQIIALIKREVVPAIGCTEPIAISYLSSTLKKLLDEDVVNVDVYVSGNILKNVKRQILNN